MRGRSGQCMCTRRTHDQPGLHHSSTVAARIDAGRRGIPRDARKVPKTSALAHAHDSATSGLEWSDAVRCARCVVHGGEGRAQAAFSGRRRVLTAKKTVIRFRHNNTWPQQRVSATRTKTRDTTQSSARMVVMVDSGVVFPAKAPGRWKHATRGAMRSGFFVSRTGSGTTRPARRRLTAGPIPAVRFVLGSRTCKSH
jgi:hypothetical protein